MYYGIPIERDLYSPLEDAQLDQIVSEIMQVSHTHNTPTPLTPRQIFEVSPRSAEVHSIDGWTYGMEEEGPLPDIDPNNS